MRGIRRGRRVTDRRAELLECIEGNAALVPLVDEVVYLEKQLDFLRSLPKIKIHPEDPTRQKATPAAKLYKELLQQYTNCIKILLRVSGSDEEDTEISPLRKWMNEHLDTGQQLLT